MTNGFDHTVCPNCGEIAEDEDTVEELFGVRNFRDTKYVQS